MATVWLTATSQHPLTIVTFGLTRLVGRHTHTHTQTFCKDALHISRSLLALLGL